MKGHPVSDIDKLCSADLVHLGMLCRRIRESHGVSLQTMATQCGVSHTTIERFELQRGSTSQQTFDRYINALGTEVIVRPHQPITASHANILTSLYRRYNARKKEHLHRERCDLAALNFADILPSHRSRDLDVLVQQLADEERPALIMDDLWFIHAFNGTLMRLFGTQPDDPLFDRWDGWHGLANKLRRDSVVRLAHVNTDEFFPATDTFFFEDDRTYPHLFTPQARHLICRMLQLSEQEDFEFHKWWLQVTSFLLPFKRESFPRTIYAQGQTITVYPSVKKLPLVTLPGGYTAQYALSIWEPDGSEQAREVFKAAHAGPRKRKPDIYYAAEYDTKNNFHVNTWPEVKKEIAAWQCDEVY